MFGKFHILFISVAAVDTGTLFELFYFCDTFYYIEYEIIYIHVFENQVIKSGKMFALLMMFLSFDHHYRCTQF